MFDDLEGMGICPIPSVKDPGVIVHSLSIGILGGSLHKHKPFIQEDLRDIWIGHQGVFVEQNGVIQVGPVYFIDGVFVGESQFELIIQIVGEDWELVETFPLVESIVKQILFSGDAQSV